MLINRLLGVSVFLYLVSGVGSKSHAVLFGLGDWTDQLELGLQVTGWVLVGDWGQGEGLADDGEQWAQGKELLRDLFSGGGHFFCEGRVFCL